MPLPSVDSALPNEIRTRQARRLARFLTHLDGRCREPVRVVLYGSAAVALYLADDDDIELGYTRDIDIGKMDPESIDLEFDAHVVDPPLTIQTHNVERWLIHPDWEQATTEVGGLLGTKRLVVELLHPVDLIITKLERFLAQDIDDGENLSNRYVDEVGVVVQRLEEAWQFYPQADRVRGQVEDACEAIFDVTLSLD